MAARRPPPPKVPLIDADGQINNDWWTWLYAISAILPDGPFANIAVSGSAADLIAGLVALARGGTGADLSATGGAHKFLRQNAIGAAIDVVQLAASDLSDGNTGTGAIVHQSGGTLTDSIDQGFLVSTSTLTKTSDTALATIPGLSIALTAGKTYHCRGHLSGTSGAAGGYKVAATASGGLTATSVSFSAASYNSSTALGIATVTALGVITNNPAIYTDIYLDGAIVVNTGGTLLIQGAQSVSDPTATTFLVNSTFSCTRVN